MVLKGVALVDPIDPEEVALDSNILLVEVLVHSLEAEQHHILGCTAAAAVARSLRIVGMKVVVVHSPLDADNLAQGRSFHFVMDTRDLCFRIHNRG